MTFAVNLSQEVDVPLTLTYSLGGGSAGFVFGGDITAAAGTYTVVIPANTTSYPIDILTKGDGSDEDDETFVLTLVSLTPATGTRNTTIVDSTGTGTVVDYGVGEGFPY
jgi:hypothetical protein